MSNAYLFTGEELVQGTAAPVEPYKEYHTFQTVVDSASKRRTLLGQLFAGVYLDMLYIWDVAVDDDIADKLKASLAQTLDHFPLMAGRLDPHNSWAVCNNHGAGFKVVHHRGIAGEVEPTPNRFTYQHFPRKDRVLAGAQPLLSVTVNVFSKGLVLAVNMCHGVVDAKSFNTFMSAWDEIHSNGKVSIKPVFHRDVLIGDDKFNLLAQDLDMVTSRLSSYIRTTMLGLMLRFGRSTQKGRPPSVVSF